MNAAFETSNVITAAAEGYFFFGEVYDSHIIQPSKLEMADSGFLRIRSLAV